MLILQPKMLIAEKVIEPVCALNAVWFGDVRHMQLLPQVGHFMVVAPQEGAKIAICGTTFDSNHYLLLNANPQSTQPILRNLSPNDTSRVLVLMIGIGFITEMAVFLGIEPDLQNLLQGVPLLQGDMLSLALQELVAVMPNQAYTEEAFMDVIGQILQLMRLRQQGLQNLSGLKERTIEDLLACLLQARQFIQANYLQPIKTVDVANAVALSEYHFARLFKAVFETTVHQYVLSLRLSHARILLEATKQPITDIALDVGYNSLSAFINAFKKATDVSPSVYRAKFQN